MVPELTVLSQQAALASLVLPRFVLYSAKESLFFWSNEVLAELTFI